MASHEFNLIRTIAVALAGGLLYRLEVPAWFRLLDRFQVPHHIAERAPLIVKPNDPQRRLSWFGRTIGAMVYFSPLWIMRHVFIIIVATSVFSGFDLIPALALAASTGIKSFLMNTPLSIFGNYYIQEKLPFKYRLLASSIMSGIFAVAYALTYRYLR